MNIAIQYFKSPVGELIIGVYNNKLCLFDWRYRKMRNSIDKRIQNQLQSNFIEQETPLHLEVIQQLNEYFINERELFNLPMLLIGTDFQKNIWELLMQVPYGSTSTYKELSIKYGNLKAIRAVATANGANAISIIVPCHRIIGSNGEMVGYAGGIKTKEKLLSIENQCKGKQTLLFE